MQLQEWKIVCDNENISAITKKLSATKYILQQHNVSETTKKSLQQETYVYNKKTILYITCSSKIAAGLCYCLQQYLFSFKCLLLGIACEG